MNDILRILDKEKNGVVRAKIAQMLGLEEEQVDKEIKDLEKNNVIVGYKTLINWDKTDCEVVTALIELRVTPQRGEGFDKIAERIYKYPQVTSLYLMSGAYDLADVYKRQDIHAGRNKLTAVSDNGRYRYIPASCPA